MNRAMTSRESILGRLRQADVVPVELPASPLQGIQYHDPVDQFQKSLEFVGGRVVRVPPDSTWQACLAALPVTTAATRICSAVPDLGLPHLSVNSLPDPHACHDIDLFVGIGHFGVAENGAVWVTDTQLRHRVLYFLCQHLVLLVPQSQIVHNLHEAYARLSFVSNDFGAFISGPSKTADIEQSLVIGAHGARSLTILLHA